VAVAQPTPAHISSDSPVFMTLAEYRTIAENAEIRYEYSNGEVTPMPGGSSAHSCIAVDITTCLNIAVRGSSFQIYNGDLRIWIPSFNHGTYADILVINGEPVFNDGRTDEILNPLLIIEVLSPSTEAYDRGDKFRKYRSVSTFGEYLLVSQSEPYVEHYQQILGVSPSENRWQLQSYDLLEQSIALQSINVELSMQEIYRRVNFAVDLT
jgi:Uma2 family endonuclease